MLKGAVYFESEDHGTGQEVEILLLFSEGYPLEAPVIYLPGFKESQEIGTDGKLSALPKNWASSPILTELIEDLFDYIAGILDSSHLSSSGSGEVRADVSPIIEKTKPGSTGTVVGWDLQHDETLETEYPQFSSSKVESNVGPYNDDSLSDLINPTKRIFEENNFDIRPWTDMTNTYPEAQRAHDSSESESESLVDASGEMNRLLDKNCLDRDSEHISTEILHKDIADVYKHYLEHEITGLNSDSGVLQRDAEKTFDDITNIEEKICQCKRELKNINKDISKHSKVMSMTTLSIDQQVRSNRNCHLKAEVRAINDTMSILILALHKKSIQLKQFLQTSGQLGREKFLFKYMLQERRKQLANG